jgi:hypothetical protein
MEGMYINADPEIQAMMRMYEFIEIEGLLVLDLFDRQRKAKRSEAAAASDPPAAEQPA